MMDSYNNQTSGNYHTGGTGSAIAERWTSTTAGKGELGDSPSRLRDGLGVTEGALSEIHEAISALERRLDTVLTPTAPAALSNAVTPASPLPPGSHVCGRLQIVNDGFAHAAARLRELTQRVEV